MIQIEYYQPKDVEEHAIYTGFRDAAEGLLPVRTFASTALGQNLELLYQLAYEFEKTSNLEYENAKHFSNAFVRDWNDLLGWGDLEFVYNGQVQKAKFSYHELPGYMAENALDPGTVVSVEFKFVNGRIAVLAVRL